MPWRRPWVLAAAAMLCLAGGVARADSLPLAFPGAEGAGRHAVGGRGGAVLKVTNLADSGPGSLRAAVNTPGARTIVFDVGGTIRLKSDLVIRTPRITIAGQSAPGGGITLADYGLVVRADDVVVRFVRVRRGDRGGEGDSVWVAGGRRIILDHVSASWSTDETLSASARYGEGEGVYDLTVQWSIISESLRRSIHAKGEHGYGSLVRGGRGSRFSFRCNLWAHHAARMPRPGNYAGTADDPEGAFMEFSHNIFYHWGGAAAGYNADKAARSAYDFVGNDYRPGPDSRGRFAFREQNSLSSAHFSGNRMDSVVPDDPWSLVRGSDRAGYRRALPLGIAPEGACAVAGRDAVLARAGASLPRDAVDVRIVAEVGDRTGRLIDSQEEVGGWPTLAAGLPPQDSDGDGMPDEWERANRHDPHRPDGHLVTSAEGYTNLELYLADRARRAGAPSSAGSE